MFKSVPLVLVNIQVPQDQISRATAVLARLRIMHLINLVETPLGKLGYVGELERDLLDRYQSIGEEVDRWGQTLGIIPQVVEIPPDLDPAKDIYPLEEADGPAAGPGGTAAQAIPGGDGETGKVQGIPAEPGIAASRRVGPGHPGGPAVDLSGARLGAHGKSPAPGAGPGEVAPRPDPRDPGGNPHPGPGSSPGHGQGDPGGGLEGGLLRAAVPAPGAAGTLDETLADVEAQVQNLEEAARQMETRRHELRDQMGPELVRIRNRIDLTRTLLRARVLFGKVDRSYLVSGWIPASLVDKLKEALAQELGEQAVLEVLSAEAVPGAREGVLKIPILFNNPYLLRPFERLTTAYGTPAYGEVEPTAFLAVSFLLMFGLMFGDVGQGAVLFLLGYVIFHRFFRYTDYGIILMECGVASTVFGCLYGSVFGLEDLIPALWFRPMKEVTYFLKMAIIFGVAAISLGLILSFINALRLRSVRLPGADLLAALFYWILAGLGLRYLLTGAWAWDFWVAVGVAAVTLGLGGVFVLQRLWLAPPKVGSPAEGWSLKILEGVIEVVDGTIRFVANTISFIRIAAFALAHAGLFVAVFSLADTLSRMGGGGPAYWLTIFLGNVVIILLEGLVVSIQIVRLEYYEFMSKFFHGGGERFKPLERGADLG